jgi:hypothetical protein
VGEGGGGPILLNIQPPHGPSSHIVELHIVVLGQDGPKPKGPMGITHVHKAPALGLVV